MSNQTLKANEAAFRQAQALVQEARAALFPTLTGNTGFNRSQQGNFLPPSNQYSLGAEASWEIDVWGRIRRTIEENAANAQASAADLASARLSLQAALGVDYFELRAADSLKILLDKTVEDYKRSLQITQNQYATGVAAKADVITAQTQLLSTQAQDVNVGVQRAQLEHAIAVLAGKAPSEFSLEPGILAANVPVALTGLPSDLLERRPDIAAAERQMAAANAGIGIAVAAYYPDVTLSASYGYAAATLGKLVQAASRVWSVGPEVSETIFDGGLRSAEVEGARALYDQNVATYRQTVLTGFQQVEDQLAALRILEQQAGVEAQAVSAAEQAEQLELNQYRAGVVPYTSVITAQAIALADEETALTVLENRQVASVNLIQAIGGGWDAGQLPSRAQMIDAGPGIFP